MKVLEISAHFSPNLGGVETHLLDLINVLIKRNWQVFVLTYRPLTSEAKWYIYEKQHNLMIFRLPWIPGLFYRLIHHPFLEFLYLFPGLFFVTPLLILIFDPEVINGHGLVAGFVSVFWGWIFKKRVIVTTHSIYSFPKNGLYREFVKWIFSKSDFVLGLSKQAADEIKSLIGSAKVDNFIYWIDLNKFKIQGTKLRIKKRLRWEDKFIVLFVGRLVKEKGVIELLEAGTIWDKKITLIIIGSGPLKKDVEKKCEEHKNIIFLDKIAQSKMPLYYNGADVLIVPSTSEEGFGRVIIESLACGTPVIGSKRGAISEAMDGNVGKLINVNPINIKNEVEYFFTHQNELEKLAGNSREFAEKRYSEKNADKIIKVYTG